MTAPRTAQATGSVRSRAYIIAREPAPVRRFDPAACPLIVVVGSHTLPRASGRVRYHHHHLSGPGGADFPPPAQRAGPADRPGTAALRPVFGPRRGPPLVQ